MVVRAYFNWRVGTANSFLRQYHEGQRPHLALLSAHTGPQKRTFSSLCHADPNDKMDEFGILHHPDRDYTKKAAIRFFKFPNISEVSAIAVCPFSGNVAIAAGNLVR